MWLKSRQVDSDDLIIGSVRVSAKEVVRFIDFCRSLRNRGTTGRVQVGCHAGSIGKKGGCGSDFGSHVANRSHTSTTKGFNSRSVVLYDVAGTTANSQLTSQGQDYILRGSPAAEFALETDSKDFRGLKFPRGVDEGFDGIGAANTDGNGAESPPIRSVYTRNSVSTRSEPTSPCGGNSRESVPSIINPGAA